MRIIVGEEIRTPDGDVIGLFLTERIPYVLPLAEVIGLIRGQGGLVYVPHPFDLVRSSLGRVLPGLCAAGQVDVIEVFNAKIADQALNERAADLAADTACPAGRAGRARRARRGRGLPGHAGLRRPGQLPRRARDAQVTGEFRDHAPRYPRRRCARGRAAPGRGAGRASARRDRNLGAEFG